MDAPIVIAREAPDQPSVAAMLAEADAFFISLYPVEECHLLDVARLSADDVQFFVARVDGDPVGFCALVDHGDWGEVKRMYTAPVVRGRGVGRRLLETVEQAARAGRLPVLRLETGDKLEAAITMYETAGYRRRGVFGGYPDLVDSIYFEKAL